MALTIAGAMFSFVDDGHSPTEYRRSDRAAWRALHPLRSPDCSSRSSSWRSRSRGRSESSDYSREDSDMGSVSPSETDGPRNATPPKDGNGGLSQSGPDSSVSFKNSVFTKTWKHPHLNAPILLCTRKWADLLIKGIKIAELRNYFQRQFSKGDTVYIACTKNGKSPSQILGSVDFSSQRFLDDSEFESLRHLHRVENRMDAPKGSKKNGQLVCWFFENAQQAPSPIAYSFPKGAMSRRKYQPAEK